MQKTTISLEFAANHLNQICHNTPDFYSLDKGQRQFIEVLKEAISQYLGKAECLTSQLVKHERSSSQNLIPHLGMEFNNPVQFMLGNLAYLSEYIQDLFKLLRFSVKYYSPIVPEIKQYAEAIKLEFIVEDLPKVINSLEREANRISKLILRLHRFGTRTMALHKRLDSIVLILQPQQNATENPTDIQVIKEYGSVPELRGDFAWLTLVLINVLILAIHTLEESTASKLEARAKKSDLQPIDAILKPTLRICTQVDEKNQIVIRIGDYRIQLSLDSEQRLHAEAEPAITWGNGYGLYRYHGVTLPEKYGKLPPREWQAQWILSENNAELRRVLIQGIGYARICTELQATELDSWAEYSLLKIDQIIDVDREAIYLLKMTCPSTGLIHALRVPPNMQSAREAIAWVNWGVDPLEFSVQT